MKTALFEYLMGSTTLTALIGSRLYPGMAPARAPLPRVTYEKSNTDGQPHYGGASGLVSELWKFDCWADTALTADALAEAIRNRLNGKLGTIGTSESVEVRGTFIQDCTDAVLVPIDGSDKPLYQASVTYKIWRFESIPTLV